MSQQDLGLLLLTFWQACATQQQEQVQQPWVQSQQGIGPVMGPVNSQLPAGLQVTSMADAATFSLPFTTRVPQGPSQTR